MSVVDYYRLDLLLLDKTIATPTNINVGKVVNGDLTPFRHRVELVNTGNGKTDNGVITVRIPPDGTFIRKEPILIDEDAKDKYLIQAQIVQPDGAGGERKGKLFRFTIGRPTMQDDPGVGELLKIQLIPMEYRTKEHLQSEQLFFRTAKEAFEARAIQYNLTKGTSEPSLVFTPGPSGSIDLPDDVKTNYEVFAPTKTHDLFREIVERQAIPGVGGGVFTDFFFDFEALDINTNIISLIAEKFGETDTGLTITPLSTNTPDAEKDKTINIDLIAFKNNVIVEGSARGGTLPMEKSRFTSNHEHAKLREVWESGRSYFGFNDPSGNPQTFVRIEVLGSPLTTYWKCIVSHTSDSNNIPTGVDDSTVWDMDFITIPEWTPNAQYYDGKNRNVLADTGTAQDVAASNQRIQIQSLSIVTHENGPNATEFFQVQIDAVSGNINPEQVQPVGSLRGSDDEPPLGASDAKWLFLFSFPTDQITAFVSYTPWTSDLESQRSNMSSIDNGTVDLHPVDVVPDPDLNYVGLIPDWNFVRANYDRVEADNQFETISFKSVQRTDVTSQNPTNLTTREAFNGARFLIKGTGAGEWAGKDDKIAERFQPVGSPFSSGSWKFSKAPATSGNDQDEAILDLKTAEVVRWNTTDWTQSWNIVDDNTVTSPFHAVRDLLLTTGSTGVAGQATRLRFDWNTIPAFPNSSFFNLSSRGAWWTMHLPYPRQTVTGHTIGDVYSRSTLDTRNLNYNRKDFLANGAGQGWNRGLDSEDLGRISQLSMKVRLTAEDNAGVLIGNLANMPMTMWAVDIFDRIWFAPFNLRRNGEYSLIKVNFGETAPQSIHHNRIDELFDSFGFTFSQNFFLKQKEFTGIEFDFRFVRGWGMFWNVAYDDNGMYIGVRNNIPDIIGAFLNQLANYGLAGIIQLLSPAAEPLTALSLIIDHVFLDIDEFAFEKQLYTNSDDTANVNARTKLEHLQQETDYINLKVRAQGFKERSRFINQSWFMKAHGDNRMRLGQRFKATGSRVPFQPSLFDLWLVGTSFIAGDKVRFGTPPDEFAYRAIRDNIGQQPDNNPDDWENMNELVCSEVKHIIDSDGYMNEFTGVRKFLLVA